MGTIHELFHQVITDLEQCQMQIDEFMPRVQMSTLGVTHGSKSSKRRRRRKNVSLVNSDNGSDEMQWDMHEDILERVLAHLPVSTFFRYRAVCKGWNSLISSPSFIKTCAEVPSRSPWFYMVDPRSNQNFVYDTEVNRWHPVKHPCNIPGNDRLRPVASAGGLVCFRSLLGDFIVCNPLTSCFRKLPPLENAQSIHAIAMVSSQTAYKVVAICGKIPAFVVKVYDSARKCWMEPCLNLSKEKVNNKKAKATQNISIEDGSIYFLNKGGNVVTREMRHNPSKEFSSILTSGANGKEMVYFLNRGGKIVSCNMMKRNWNELPPLLPSTSDYSIDLVDCGGRMLVVVLHEIMETASVRIWEYNDQRVEWVQVLAMHPSMSHEYYGKKADISCVGYNNLIMICIHSGRFNRIVLCDIAKNSWLELPRCYVPGSRKVKKFVTAYPFEPRLEVSV